MKFSAIFAISTLAMISGVSALPLEMAYRSRNSYQTRDILPSGEQYPRAAAPEPVPIASAVADVPQVNPATSEDDTDDSNPGASVYTGSRRLTAKQRRSAIRARSPVLYERDPEAEPEAEPEASPEAEADPVVDDDDEELLLDDETRAALLRRLIAAEEEAAEKKANDYIRSFRFHRRAVDYVSY